MMAGVFSDVIVATCDADIAQEVARWGGRFVMTSSTHQAATDRVAEAAESLDCTHVVNVQGDEILVLPEDLALLVRSMRKDPGVEAWNAVDPVGSYDQLSDRSVVKCVISESAKIMYCSRDFSHVFPSPAATYDPVRIILGILAYRKDFLLKYGRMARAPLESVTSVDQNRILENDVTIASVGFACGYPGINEPREVPLVERFLSQDQRQNILLAKILDCSREAVA